MAVAGPVRARHLLVLKKTILIAVKQELQVPEFSVARSAFFLTELVSLTDKWLEKFSQQISMVRDAARWPARWASGGTLTGNVRVNDPDGIRAEKALLRPCFLPRLWDPKEREED